MYSSCILTHCIAVQPSPSISTTFSSSRLNLAPLPSPNPQPLAPTFPLSVPHHVSEAPSTSNTQLYLRTQSCATLCDPMDCSPPGSSVDGVFQASILEWVASFYCRNIHLAPSKIFSTRSPSSFLHCKRRLSLSLTHTHTRRHTLFSTIPEGPEEARANRSGSRALYGTCARGAERSGACTCASPEHSQRRPAASAAGAIGK